jgi:hypothetical protein
LEEDDDVTFSCLEFLILADQCWLVDWSMKDHDICTLMMISENLKTHVN